MPLTLIRVYNRDTLALYAQINLYESAYFTRSWSDCGDFEIVINATPADNLGIPYASYFQRGRIVQFGTDPRDCGIITEIVKPIDESGKGSQKWSVKGFELKWFFNLRSILPPAGSDNYAITSNGENVIKSAVAAQFTSATDTNRNSSLLTIATNLNRGALTYAMSACGTSLAEELKKCSLATLVGYWVYIDFTAEKYVLECSIGLNRSSSQTTNTPVIFSTELHTLRSATVTDSETTYRNLAYSAASVQGAAKAIRKIYNSTEPTGLDRREVYIEANNVVTTADMDNLGYAKLSENQYTLQLDAEALAYGQFIFGTDYDVGDTITLITPDITKDAQVTQVRRSWSALKYEIAHVFDKPAPTLTGELQAQAATLNNALANSNNTVNYPAQTYLGIVIPAGPNVPVRVVVSSGTCEVWPDGTLKQWFSVTASTSSAISNGFYYKNDQLFNFPISFANSNVISSISPQFIYYIGSGFQSDAPTSTNISMGFMASGNDSFRVNITSIGRWR